MISKRHITARGHSVLGPKNPLLGGGVNTPFLMNRLRTQIDCCGKLTVSGILKGVAIDGYISGAEVTIYDTKTNKEIAKTTTNQLGAWEISNEIFNENSDYYKIVIRGGTDIVSGNTIDIELVSYGKPNTNSITITPTTTLVSYLIDDDTSTSTTFEQKLDTHKTRVKTLVASQNDPFAYDFIGNNDLAVYKTNVLLYQYLSLYKGNTTKKTELISNIKSNSSDAFNTRLTTLATSGTINGKSFSFIATDINSSGTIDTLNDTIKSIIGTVAPIGSVSLNKQKGKSGATITLNATFDTVMDSAVPCKFQLVDSTSLNLLSSDSTLTVNPQNKKIAIGTFTVPTGNIQAKIKFLTGKSLGGIALASTPSNNPTFIIDNTAPVITLNGSNNVQINVGTSYTDPGATAVDSVDGNCLVTSSLPISTASTGEKTITYTARDEAGNTSTASRTIRVVDPNGPTITLNPGLGTNNGTDNGTGTETIYLEAGTNFNYIDAGATASDSGGASVSVVTENINGQTPNTLINDIANNKIKTTYTIKYTATNQFNQTSTKTRTVIVRDTRGPVITLAAYTTPVQLEQKGISSNEFAKLPSATAIDAVDGDVSVTKATTNVNLSLSGDYIVVYTATDSAGNKTEIPVQVSVRDTQPPEISATSIETPKIEATNSTEYVDPGGFVAIDAVDGDVTNKIIIDATGVNLKVPGSYRVDYSVSDAAGNVATLFRNVTVEDTTPPELTVPSGPFNVVVGGTFDFKTGVSAVDIVDGDVTNNIIVSSDTVGIFPEQFDWNTSNATTPTVAGTYSIEYNVKDSANNEAAPQTRTLVVTGNNNANTAPTLTVPINSQTTFMNNVFDHTFQNSVSANDVQDGDITANIQIICTLEPNTGDCVIIQQINNTFNQYNISFIAPGDYTLQYSITDSGRLTTTSDVNISVIDVPIQPFVILPNPNNEIYYVKGDTDNSIKDFILNGVSAFAGESDITNNITLTIEKIYPIIGDNGSLITSGDKFVNYVISADNAVIDEGEADINGLIQNVYKLTYSVVYNGATDSKIRYLIIGNKKYRIGITSTKGLYLSGELQHDTLGKYIFTDVSGCKSHIQRMCGVLEDVIYRPLSGKTVNTGGIVENLNYNGYGNIENQDLYNKYSTKTDEYGRQGPFDFVVDISTVELGRNGRVAADYYGNEHFVDINGEQIRTETVMLFNLSYYANFSDQNPDVSNSNASTALHELLHGHRVGSDLTFAGSNIELLTNDDPSSNFIERMKFFKGPNTFNYYKKKLTDVGFSNEYVNNLIGVPLESTYIKGGGLATTGAHWEDNTLFDTSGTYYPAFYKDIMRGFSGTDRYFSKLTANCLIDIGYPNINMKSKYIKEYSDNDIIKDAFSINYVNYKTAVGIWTHLDYYTIPFNGANYYNPITRDSTSCLNLYISAFYYNNNDTNSGTQSEIYAKFVKLINNSLVEESGYIKMNSNSTKSNYYDIYLLIGAIAPSSIPNGYNFVSTTNNTPYNTLFQTDYAAIEFYYKNNTGDYIKVSNNLNAAGDLNNNDYKDETVIAFTFT
jgi:hypothetical protein